MNDVIAWLLAPGWKGAPHWVPLAITVLLAADYVLPKLKNPRARSIGEVAFDLLGYLLGRFPVFGPLVQLLVKYAGSPKPQAQQQTAEPPKPPVPPTLSVLLPFVLIPALVSGCAQYSACVKSSMSAAFKEDTASQIEKQIADVLNLAASAEWVAMGLKAAEDVIDDTGGKALVFCAVSAWQQAHPMTTTPTPQLAAAHEGAARYKALHPTGSLPSCAPTIAAR